MKPLLLFVLVVLSRLPFLTRSYGLDGDAWSVAYAAGRIVEEGRYVWSRPPGFPVQELLSAAVWSLGPLALNTLTVVWSAIAAVLFYGCLRHLKVGSLDAFLGGLALASAPVVFIHSTVSLDYLWALAGLAAAVRWILLGKAEWAGVALGVAVGCRITSLIYLLPLAGLLAVRTPVAARRRGLIQCAGATLVTAALCYVPVVMRYGFDFLRFNDEAIDEALRGKLMAYGFTVGTWGVVGTAVVGLAVIRASRFRGSPDHRDLRVAAVVGVGVCGLAFARLPLEWGYLVPAVLFGLLWVAVSVPPAWWRLVCAGLILSPWVGHAGFWGGRSLAGPVIQDFRGKQEQLASVAEVYALVNGLEGDEVVLVTGKEIDRFRAFPPDTPGFAFTKRVPIVRSVEKETPAIPTVFLVKHRHVYVGAKVRRMEGAKTVWFPEVLAGLEGGGDE